jgi:hypothetical protein
VNPRFKALPGDVLFARCRDVFRNQDVDAVRLAVDMIVDPFQLLLDGIRRMRRRTQHAKAAGAAHGRNHVAAMAEGKQGKLDSQHVANRRFHGCVLSLRQLSMLLIVGLHLRHWPDASLSGAGKPSEFPGGHFSTFHVAKYATPRACFASCALALREECCQPIRT